MQPFIFSECGQLNRRGREQQRRHCRHRRRRCDHHRRGGHQHLRVAACPASPLDRSGDVGGDGTVAIYVPWAVFRELDALKSRLVWGSFSASINVMLLPSYLMPCVAFLQIVLH